MSINRIINELITFTNTIGVSQDGTLFYGSKWTEQHTDITLVILFGNHSNKKLAFWNKFLKDDNNRQYFFQATMN